MTDPHAEQVTPEGEESPQTPPPEGSFGDQAAEMVNESEVESDPAQDRPVGADLSKESVLEPTAEADELAVMKMELAERTSDLQRLQAEFVNYKRRVDRDRELIRENATYTALAPITEVLDTIDRAREHAPLEDGFKAVADQLERIVSAVGFTKFGEAGDPFDPTVHEALSHIGEDPEVSVTTCKVIAKAGYRIGGRVVRAAQVLVVDPASGPAGGPAGGEVAEEAPQHD